MDFFNSLNEVRKNSSQLDRWEQQQRDKDAQRKAYQAKHAPTSDEVKRAQELGETLINVIDTMDDHSESVAENVETIAEPISTVSLIASGLLSGYLAWKFGIKPSNKKLKEMEEAFDKDKKNIEFTEKLNKARTSIKLSNGEILDNMHFDTDELRGSKRHLEKITDSTLRNEALEINKTWKKSISGIKLKNKLAFATIPVAAITGWIMGNIYETKLQVDSSRIARFQARRELKDPKAFVNYTPEQIAQAKAELEKHPERIKKGQKTKLKKGLFTSLRELIRDSDNYKQTRKLREKQQSMVTRPLTEAEILQAKKDQEVIQRVVKKINNEAEKNSEKMETAADVIMGTFPIVGGTIGFLATLGLEKTGLIKKWVGKYVEKHGTQEAKDAFKELAKLKRTDPKYDSAWKEFYGEFSGFPQTKKQWEKHWKNDRLKNEVENLSKGDKKAKAIKKMKDLFAGAMVHKTKGRWFIGLASGLLAAFPSAIIAMKLQKDASRAGRFTAKRELEKDPVNFIGYSDTELNEVKDVKNTDKEESKFKEYALFIPRVIRDWWKYNNYRNHDLKEKQALNAELKKLDVTDEQLRDAKNLQAKVFTTFEKVDDKSQAYSEATEAAIQTAQPFVIAGGYLTAISPLIYFGIQAGRGKYTPAKITEKVTNVVAKFSNILNTKLFKGYLKGVDKHVAKVVADTDTTSVKYGEIFKGIDILKTPLGEMIPKAITNTRNHLSTTFRNMDSEAQRSAIWLLSYKLRESKSALNKLPKETRELIQKQHDFIEDLLRNFRWLEKAETRADIFDIITFNKDSVAQMTPERFNTAREELIKIIGDEKNIDTFSELLGEMQSKLINNVLDNDLIEAGLKSDNQNTVSELADKTKIKEMIKELLDGLNKGVTKENYIDAVGKLDMTEIINAKTIPLKLEDVPGIIKDISQAAQGAAAASKLAGRAAGTEAGSLAGALSKVDMLTSPKAALNGMADMIKAMDEKAYQEFLSSTPFRGWEKDSVVKIIHNISKVWDNIPKEHFKGIMGSIVKQFNENPDKTIEALKSGAIMKMFATPQLKKALAAAGITWTVFTAVMTYIVSSWLAELQLRAGRLGVKKAMDDLEDYRYYANVIPEPNAVEETKAQSTTPETTATPTAEHSNLLAKFKK